MRLVFIAIFALLCFSLLVGRFVWLQVVKHKMYALQADENRISIVPMVPNRGLIMDRNGVILAH